MNLQQALVYWKQVRAGLVDTIQKFNDSDLAYKPFLSSWPAGQIMLHIAEAEEGWFRFAVMRGLEKWPDGYTLENYPTRDSISATLATVHEYTVQFLESLTGDDSEKIISVPWGEKIPLPWIIRHVVEHEIHHRGELSLILGILGRDGLDV